MVRFVQSKLVNVIIAEPKSETNQVLGSVYFRADPFLDRPAMRWFWFDRYTEFVSGRYAVAIKNVTLAEEHLHDLFPMRSDAELAHHRGLAQTGGLLVGEAKQFERRVVLAKVSKAKFHLPALPGDTLIYRTDVEYIREDGAMVTAKSMINAKSKPKPKSCSLT